MNNVVKKGMNSDMGKTASIAFLVVFVLVVAVPFIEGCLTAAIHMIKLLIN